MRASHRKLLILVNAFAAAMSFVGAWLVADRIPFEFPFPLLTIILGLVGVAHFTRRAEDLHKTLRAPGHDDQAQS